MFLRLQELFPGAIRDGKLDLLVVEPTTLIDLDSLDELFDLVRGIDTLTEDHIDLFDHVYRGRVRHALFLRHDEVRVRALYDHLRRTAALLRNRVELAGFVRALRAYASLLDTHLGCLQTRDLEAVMARGHVQRILAFLQGKPDGVPRSEIARALGIYEAFVAQCIALMERHDLVTSRHGGDEVTVFLSADR